VTNAFNESTAMAARADGILMRRKNLQRGEIQRARRKTEGGRKLYDKLPFDVLKDFTPISLVALTPSVLVVHPSLPVKSGDQHARAVRGLPQDRHRQLGESGEGVGREGGVERKPPEVNLRGST
jgi:hypothetical protein